ncbi:GNAT family N-acetyltransferase [Enterococcus faecium]|nr:MULTISPECIES: GNAT family N-acetyltransferase [Enterococcus]MDB1165102.1 GNAT family N-acetyltransferase [Enterococcus faecium]MDB1173322.1 GNAT family N-acetyltransferase [Enterococcus faecium]HAQ8898503.1 GNAT family N-acetyltransferase [Enterococcus faecium]HAQ8898820.1 GNAT family N-acetyltransferase [Enterococcus faecium]HBL8366676.1 GNAT family N-acetyltransferase [Enterococcus faecium]
MELIHLDYDETKKITIKELGDYVIEKFPELKENSEKNNEVPVAKETKNFSFGLKKEGTILGKLFGEIDHLNSAIRINGLIVEKAARGTGAGSILIKKAEELGRKEGCYMSFVNTTLSTAPGFYEKPPMLG